MSFNVEYPELVIDSEEQKMWESASPHVFSPWLSESFG